LRGPRPDSMSFSIVPFRVARSAALALICVATGKVSIAQQNVGELFAADASVKGAVVLANSGTKVMSGSSISAGEQAATLKLERGGSMMICPNTSLAVTTSQNGRQMMFSMNTGNLEMDYPIGAASDNLLTPDFRVLMPGPGRLHLAVRVNAKGDTCVQSLASNSSAVVVSEGMGDASYQVKPNEAVVFNGGRISGAMPTHESCGCPAPPPMQVARVASPPPAATEPPKSGPPEPQTHMVVDAPFIYRAGDPVNLTENVAHLRRESKPMGFEPVVTPPPPSAKAAKAEKTATATNTAKPAQPKQGFFGKISAFFAGIFH
ncbi:MAG TPA: hypothetical protein VE779_08740, partial [Candidatus Angelobacter sp.]|nr:hypothetical protein [Candidatus Angelobacter sp.]